MQVLGRNVLDGAAAADWLSGRQRVAANAARTPQAIERWAAIGRAASDMAEQHTQTEQTGSQVASLNGNVNLTAGKQYTQTASGALALGTGADGKAGNITIAAQNVVIDEAYRTSQTLKASQASQTTLGTSVNVPLYNTAKGIADTVRAAAGQAHDSRTRALGAAVAGLEGYQTYQNIASGNLGGGKVSLTLTHSQSQSASIEAGGSAVGSAIHAAGNASIVASGAGAGSNITATAANIHGKNVALAADNRVTLQAAQNKTTSFDVASGSSQSIGVGFGVGAQNGVTIEAGASAFGAKNTARNAVCINHPGALVYVKSTPTGEELPDHHPYRCK